MFCLGGGESVGLGGELAYLWGGAIGWPARARPRPSAHARPRPSVGSVGSFLCWFRWFLPLVPSVGSIRSFLPLVPFVPSFVGSVGSFRWFLPLVPFVPSFRWFLPLVSFVPSFRWFRLFLPLLVSLVPSFVGSGHRQRMQASLKQIWLWEPA